MRLEELKKGLWGYRKDAVFQYIAQQEGLDVTDAVIAGLLHDIAYCEEMPTQEA